MSFNLYKDIETFVVSALLPFGNKEFDTLLITRFNIEFGFKNPKIYTSEYLAPRFHLFEKYTFPSVNNQTDKDFTWIVLFSTKTPQEFKDRIENLKQKAMVNFQPVFVDRDDKTFFEKLNYIPKKNWVLSCRVDNDDMIANNYIEEMKKKFIPFDNTFVDFCYGYNYLESENKLNFYKCRNCHFIAYIEKVKDNEIKTVYFADHSQCGMVGKIRRTNNKKFPLWCEIIHTSNEANEFRGDVANSSQIQYFKEAFGSFLE